MVRFKVVKASHLLLGVAVAVLLIVIITVVLSMVLSKDNASISTQANLVQFEQQGLEEAETNTVFASSNASTALGLDPGDGDTITIDILPQATSSVSRPTVLIYHTHTHEAYEQVSEDRYVAIEAWRTMDEGHSVVRVGEELAEELRMRGFDVVHDTTDHELSELKTAYTRSLDTLEGYTQRFDLYIDLHRDAYIEGEEIVKVYDGDTPLAQMMLLIGNGVGFSTHQFYEENLAFANALTDRINEEQPGLCKDVLVKDGRYNQHIGVFSILVEVGHNRNTLQQALNALPYLADGLESLCIDEPIQELEEIQATFIAQAN